METMADDVIINSGPGGSGAAAGTSSAAVDVRRPTFVPAIDVGRARVRTDPIFRPSEVEAP